MHPKTNHIPETNLMGTALTDLEAVAAQAARGDLIDAIRLCDRAPSENVNRRKILVAALKNGGCQ
jgi:hypothetical protein